jgi:uncharacterized protein (UPF0216 family)
METPMGDRPEPMEKWVEREYASINAGLVTKKKSLDALRDEPAPACTARDGTPWAFDRDILDRVATHCSAAEARDLLLPVAVHFSTDLMDSCYISDSLGAAVLRRVEGFGPAFPFREGRMYLPLSLGIDLISRYKGALQQVFL